MLETEILQRLETIEAAVFQPTGDQGSGLPLSDSLPSDLEISVTASLEGAYVILSWGNWQHTIKGYEIWLERPDGSNELAKTVQYSPATLTVVTDTAAPFIFKIRPVMATGEEISIERAPAIAATIPVPVVSSGDIGNGAVQNQHIDRVSANKLVVVDADILTLTANKLTAGTINAAVISVINLNASNINTGTLTSINISAGTYSLISGFEQMTIDGINGFRQYNSSLTNFSQMFGGQFTVGQVGGIYIQIDYSGAAGNNANGGPRWNLQHIGSGGALALYWNPSSASAPTPQVYGAASSTGGAVQLYDSGATLRIELLGTASPAISINSQQVVGPRLAAITAPAGGSTVDAEARTAIGTIISRLQSHGLTA